MLVGSENKFEEVGEAWEAYGTESGCEKDCTVVF